MLTLTEFSRKQRSDKGRKRSKKSSGLDNTLKKSQVFRNVLNPINNTLREVRGSVKTGLQVAEHIKKHRPKLQSTKEKFDNTLKTTGNVTGVANSIKRLFR